MNVRAASILGALTLGGLTAGCGNDPHADEPLVVWGSE